MTNHFPNTICKNGKIIYFDEIAKCHIYKTDKSIYYFKKDNDVYYELDENEGFVYSIMKIYYKGSLKIKYPYFLNNKIDAFITKDYINNLNNRFKKLPFMYLNECLIELLIRSIKSYTLDDRYVFDSQFFENGDLDTCCLNGEHLIFKRNNNLFLSNYLYDDYLEQIKEVNQYIEVIDFNLLVALDKKSVAIASDNFKFDFFIHGEFSDNQFKIKIKPKDENHAIDENFSDKVIKLPIKDNNYHALMEATIDILLQISANNYFHILMRKYIQGYNDIVTSETIKIYRMLTS